MSDFDPLNDRAYTERLTELGEKREIIASEDIFNEQGLLLVRKGAPINQKIADKIVRFKLIKPIESSVDIENSVSAQDLYRDISTSVKHHEQINTLYQRINIDAILKHLCAQYGKYPIIRQKLTVMREQMPKLYWQSIGVTWLSVLMAARMRLSETQIETCFFAGLCHDVGMMHIDPAVVEKTEMLTPAEWRQIQAHAVISQKLVQSIQGLKPSVARTVLEHHERCDGTGYPNGKFSDQLCLESQILALAESAIVVYTNRLIPKGRGLRDLMPLLQVNSESHFYDTYKALILLMRDAELDEKPYINSNTVASEIERVRSKNDQLSHMLQGLEALLSRLKEQNEHKLIVSARTVLIQILRIVRGSGILDEGYLRWLEQVKKEKLEFAYREVDDVALMLDEIEWHILRIKKMLDSFLEHAPTNATEIKDLIRAGLEAVPSSESAPISEYSIN